MPSPEIDGNPRIIDATLREGRQAPGVAFGTEESVAIALGLAAIGVDAIECGHPYASTHEAERVRAVVSAVDPLPVLAHARARREDIDAVARTGAPWVGIFVGVNDVSRRAKMRSVRSFEQLIREAVAHAKSRGLKVRFTVEDASRTNSSELVGVFGEAVAQGADRICFADTVGALLPWEVGPAVDWFRLAHPTVPLEVHLHDDRGLSMANALMAIRAGAAWVSAAVNGIGERCGITDTVTLVANLGALGWRTLPDGGDLQWLSRLVAAHARMPPDRWRPVVGANAFTHTAKLHREAVALEPSAYAWIDPRVLGRSAESVGGGAPFSPEGAINKPKIVDATELRHHRRGPGERYLMLDERVVSDARQYCVVRSIPALDDYGAGHVGAHRHGVDSLLLFVGHGDGLTGLEVEVMLGGELFAVSSPASVFVPAGIEHSYRVVGGSGLFVNHVPAGDYNASLLERPTPWARQDGHTSDQESATPGLLSSRANGQANGQSPTDAGLIEAFLRMRFPGAPPPPEARLEDLLDSLAFLDFFLYLEQARAGISLDDLAACLTMSDVLEVLARARDGAMVDSPLLASAPPPQIRF